MERAWNDGLSKYEQLVRVKDAAHTQFTERTAEAYLSLLVWRKDRWKIRKTCPSIRKAPEAWAAWQGLKVHQNGEGVIANLMLYPEIRDIWDEVSDKLIEYRKRS